MVLLIDEHVRRIQHTNGHVEKYSTELYGTVQCGTLGYGTRVSKEKMCGPGESQEDHLFKMIVPR